MLVYSSDMVENKIIDKLPDNKSAKIDTPAPIDPPAPPALPAPPVIEEGAPPAPPVTNDGKPVLNKKEAKPFDLLDSIREGKKLKKL
jgi:hypothetical protein